jgi:hypothetical protein
MTFIKRLVNSQNARSSTGPEDGYLHNETFGKGIKSWCG